jgi:hypothetical protein
MRQLLCLLAEHVEQIREWSVILATIIGTSVAILGLRTWRKQLRGRTEYELARRYLRSVYRVRDRLQAVRSIFMSAEEIGAALKEEGIDLTGVEKDEAHKRGQYAAYGRRWKAVTDATSTLELENLEAEVLWEDTTKDGYKKLNACINSLYIPLIYLLRYGDVKDDEEHVKMRKIVYKHQNDDAFSDELNGAIKDIEKVLRPKLKI